MLWVSTYIDFIKQQKHSLIEFIVCTLYIKMDILNLKSHSYSRIWYVFIVSHK